MSIATAYPLVLAQTTGSTAIRYVFGIFFLICLIGGAIKLKDGWSADNNQQRVWGIISGVGLIISMPMIWGIAQAVNLIPAGLTMVGQLPPSVLVVIPYIFGILFVVCLIGGGAKMYDGWNADNNAQRVWGIVSGGGIVLSTPIAYGIMAVIGLIPSGLLITGSMLP